MSQPTGSQQRAIAARGNVLVVAGAGTGKTLTLVQRCLTLLEAGCSLENVLMVTFTDAAAAQMRHRVREALLNRVRELERNGDLGSITSPKENFEKQLALLDTALISTLHSFCLQLVREHFYELGIDPEVRVLDERQTLPLIQQVLDNLFERLYAGETGQSLAVQSLVRVQGRGSDDRIRALVLKLHRYSQSLATPERWLGEQMSRFRQADPVEWRQWFGEGFQTWRELWLPVLAGFAGSPAVDVSVEALRRLPIQPSLAQVAEALQTILAADEHEGNWPYGSKKNVRDQVENFFAEAEFLCSLTPAGGRKPLEEDWELVRHQMIALLDLAKEFTADFSRAKRELGGVDFADVEQCALRLLRQPEAGQLTPTALRWREQFQHILVDEYQDINAAQDALLTALSREGREANRFLVGDVKQSIYRFRLADSGIFRDYERRWGNGHANAQRIALADNFRSHGGILDFINRFFSLLMRDGIGGVAYEQLNFGNAEERVAPANGDGARPRVEFCLVAKGDDENGAGEAGDDQSKERLEVADLPATEREARLVALRLRELKQRRHEVWDKDGKRFRPVEWSDMVVLLRSPAGRVEAFAQEFHHLGVPLEAARGGFFESLEISDLLCLLKLIDNPLQDIPLLAAMRSPLAGLSVDELAEIRAHNREPNFWLTLRQFHRQGDDSSSAWRKADLFLRQLDGWRDLIRQTSLSHCLETALAETYYEELLLAEARGEQRVANVRRLLDFTRQYDPYQRQGLYRFLRFVDRQGELDPEPASTQTGKAVRLTSIHKSKGLEFPVVVLAGMGWQFNLQDLREDILLDEKYGLCPKVVPPDGEQRYPSLPYWLGRQRQRRELLGEELRLLYVAMTRAREMLILTATSASKGSPKWASTQARALTDQEILSARSYLDWLKLWLPLATREADWNGDREGQSKLLRWRIYSENDPRLARPIPPPKNEHAKADADETLDADALQRLRERVAWQYSFAAATEERAKTNVTELRRRRDEEDDEAGAARFVRRSAFTTPAKPGGAMSAAEIGTTHHRFLQRVSLTKVAGVEELRNEADRLRRSGILSEAEVAALDFEALARFWRTSAGRQIAANAPAVRRELPFTARFSPADLVAAGLPVNRAMPAGEFVVVQGVIDLAVIFTQEIWLLDFKTDDGGERALEEKAATYAPQLKLYALALERVYQRRVTARWLHFLTVGRTVEV